MRPWSPITIVSRENLNPGPWVRLTQPHSVQHLSPALQIWDTTSLSWALCCRAQPGLLFLLLPSGHLDPTLKGAGVKGLTSFRPRPGPEGAGQHPRTGQDRALVHCPAPGAMLGREGLAWGPWRGQVTGGVRRGLSLLPPPHKPSSLRSCTCLPRDVGCPSHTFPSSQDLPLLSQELGPCPPRAAQTLGKPPERKGGKGTTLLSLGQVSRAD